MNNYEDLIQELAFIKNENNDSKKADNLKKIMSSMYI